MSHPKGAATRLHEPPVPLRRPPARRESPATRPLLRRPGVRRAVAGLAAGLVAFGIGMLVYPLATDVYTSRAQARLREEFAARARSAPSSGSAAAAPAVADGQGLALIQIPSLGLDVVIVEGTDPAALRNGPGHYGGSPEPCQPGNVAIAGHRTTYGQPFSGLDDLEVGQRIDLVLPQERCTYQVVAAPPRAAPPHAGSAAWVTGPADWSVVGPLRGSFVTLTTCHPKGSAAERLVVRARLVAIGPA